MREEAISTKKREPATGCPLSLLIMIALFYFYQIHGIGIVAEGNAVAFAVGVPCSLNARTCGFSTPSMLS